MRRTSGNCMDVPLATGCMKVVLGINSWWSVSSRICIFVTNDGGGCDMCSLMGGAVAFGITNTNLQKKREEKQAWGRDFCFTVNYFWDGTLMGQVLAVWIRECQTKDWTTKKRETGKQGNSMVQFTFHTQYQINKTLCQIIIINTITWQLRTSVISRSFKNTDHWSWEFITYCQCRKCTLM